jgi:hypothetical protein
LKFVYLFLRKVFFYFSTQALSELGLASYASPLCSSGKAWILVAGIPEGEWL